MFVGVDVGGGGECWRPDVPGGDAVDELDEWAGGELKEGGSAGLGVGDFGVLERSGCCLWGGEGGFLTLVR